MKTTTPRWKNQLIIFLTLTSLAGAGLALQQHRRVVELEQNGQLTVINTTTRAAVPKAYLDTPAPAEKPPTLSEVLTEEDSAAEDNPAPNRNNRRAEFSERMKVLMQDPEFVSALQIEQRARLDGRYAALFKQLNLPPAQLAMFQDLLIERQNAWRDVMITARENGLDPRQNRDQLREMSRSLQAEVDATIKAELGTKVYTDYQQYDATQAQRHIVDRLNQKLTYSGTELATTQSQQLVNIIASNGGQLNEQTINLARGLLTANQLASLQQLYAEQSAAALLREKMSRGAGGGRNR